MTWVHQQPPKVKAFLAQNRQKPAHISRVSILIQKIDSPHRFFYMSSHHQSFKDLCNQIHILLNACVFIYHDHHTACCLMIVDHHDLLLLWPYLHLYTLPAGLSSVQAPKGTEENRGHDQCGISSRSLQREEDLIQVKLKRVDWSLLCYCDTPRMLDQITETDLIKPSCVWSGFGSETECVVSNVVKNILQRLMLDISHEHLSESYSSSRRLFRTSSHFGKSMISINNSLQSSQAPRHINQIVISAFSVHLGSHGLILEKLHKLATTGTNSSSRRNIT
ncbi:hypothetical protein DY000_02049161 [Brassica cretica]|uniref:Uncharacterized protein n=1 Tax=Brassica cretica TaxID=69181 RepID=A0ABQ7F0B8_BRACR|nr:hypothetical protein DY000_02049161 [Brassica cretica]